jgi:hypothetical protein
MIEKENYYTLISIDAWRDLEGGWYWNDLYKVEQDVYIPSDATNRTILKILRETHLSDDSKGKLAIEHTGYDIEIQARGTREPIFALRPQWEI